MTPAAAAPKQAVTNSSLFTPVGDLIKETWEVTKAKWKPFLKVMALVAGIEILLAIALFGILFALGAASFASVGSPMNMITSPLMLVAVVVWAIPAIVFGTAGSVAMYRLAYDDVDDAVPVMDLLRSSIKFVLPLILTGLLTGLLVVGGFFAFIIPGIIFAILFSFAPMEVVFQGKSPLESIKASAALVKQHFGTIFVRWLAFVGVMIVAGIVIGILEGILGRESALNGLVQLVYNFVVTVFSTVYFVLLYKQVRAATDEAQSPSLVWMIVVAVVGWIMGLFILGSAIAGLASYFSQYSEMESLEDFDETQFLQEFEDLDQEFTLEESPSVPDEAI